MYSFWGGGAWDESLLTRRVVRPKRTADNPFPSVVIAARPSNAPTAEGESSWVSSPVGELSAQALQQDRADLLRYS